MSNTENKTNINDIKKEFSSLLNLNKTEYINSLEQAYKWVDNPNMYKRYSHDAKFREKFITLYLRNENFNLDKDFNTNKSKN